MQTCNDRNVSYPVDISYHFLCLLEVLSLHGEWERWWSIFLKTVFSHDQAWTQRYFHVVHPVYIVTYIVTCIRIYMYMYMYLYRHIHIHMHIYKSEILSAPWEVMWMFQGWEEKSISCYYDIQIWNIILLGCPWRLFSFSQSVPHNTLNCSVYWPFSQELKKGLMLLENEPLDANCCQWENSRKNSDGQNFHQKKLASVGFFPEVFHKKNLLIPFHYSIPLFQCIWKKSSLVLLAQTVGRIWLSYFEKLSIGELL